MATVGYTYDNAMNREDLLNLITNLTPKETQLYSGLGRSKATAIRHEWGKDTLDAVADNAKIEGADASNKTITNPTRLFNYTQILDKTYQVSGTEREVLSAGFEDRLTYEREKAMKSFANDVEYALLRGSLACGTGSSARRMRGIKSWMASNNFTNTSGTSLSETMLNDYFQQVWNDGTQVNAVYAPMVLKRRISGFTAGNTKNVNSEDRRLVFAVDVYQADAAQMVKLFAHRYVTDQAVGDVNQDLIGLNEDMWKVATLRNPNTTTLAKTGDSDREQLLGECTLECYHEDAGFWTKNLL